MNDLSRREFVARTLGIAGAVAASRLAGATAAEAHANASTGGGVSRPNVLLIISDDRNRRMGCYGDPVVKTPNMDRLAARGLRFERAYCQAPLCNPSRTSLLSGLRPAQTGVWNNFTEPLEALPNTVFLPEYFRKNGYFTARLGKVFHDVVSADGVLRKTFDGAKLWDVTVNELLEAQTHIPERSVVKWEKYPGHHDPQEWAIVEGSDLALGDAILARRTAELIEQKRDQPFFIATGFRRPHVPMVAPKRFYDLYPPERIALPPAQDRSGIPPIALTTAPGDEKMTDDDHRRITAAYLAATSFMDAQLGLVLDALDRTNAWDNTIVVFTSDHGYHLGEHGLWRKRTLFQEAARIPMIVAAPGVRAGSVSSRLVESIDLYPTFVELCGLPARSGLEGTSFAPLLRQPDRPWKRAAFSSIVHGAENPTGHAVFTERHRYSEWGRGEAMELYDLENDPHEFKNLAHDPQQAETLRSLQKLLNDGWAAAVPSKDTAQRS